MSEILVTGVAGFIGSSFARILLAGGRAVFGVVSINDYYDTSLKRARLRELRRFAGFGFARVDLARREAAQMLFASNRFDRVVHLAAQAGVRYSLENPHAYVDANLSGFLNLLEGCRACGCKHLIFASSRDIGFTPKTPIEEGIRKFAEWYRGYHRILR